MSVFNNFLGNWIQVVDEQNSLTILDYSYDTGVIEGRTGNHCVKCVAINKCWFKNELGKKPERFDLSNIKIIDYIKKSLIPELYHPNCHCKEIPIDAPNLKDIEIIVPDGKIDWLLKDKTGLINSWGYTLDTTNLLIEEIKHEVKMSYILGNYNIRNITNSGVNATFYITIHGISNKRGHEYKRVSSFMIYPNGTLKNNTLIGGKW